MKKTVGKKLFFTVVAVMVFGLFISHSGCIYAKYKGKARQTEAETNLHAIKTASIAYYGENDQWGTTFEAIGWAPEGQTRYSYYLNSCNEVIPSDATGYKGCPDALKAWFNSKCEHKDEKGNPDCFRAAAVANLDKDPKLDIWILEIETATISNLTNDVER